MAKSVLDLYELYKLVIGRGGLVNVINKKLWQEIIKDLNLPSSITSAAFTLRTQYTKYLYPYEVAYFSQFILTMWFIYISSTVRKVQFVVGDGIAGGDRE